MNFSSEALNEIYLMTSGSFAQLDHSLAHGDIAFTVPLFEEFLLREIPVFSVLE